MTKSHIEEAFKKLQLEIIASLETADGSGKFQFDAWQREEGGGGLTSVLENGSVLEKGGVNFSAVSGLLNAQAAKSLGVEAGNFFATGVSIVLHPNNPMVPIIHMNIRYFEMDGGAYWFGGGIDLTPHYVKEDQARTFHQALKQTCDKHDPSYYAEFKVWADNYFFIKHREETRGIGGIFFDRMNEESRGKSKEQLFDFVLDVGKTFAPVYTKFMHDLQHVPYSDQHKRWQLLRRGRYVEFNLVYDRGTRFGLETGGRTESILMSLPAEANWKYDFKAEPGSEEEKTLSLLKKGLEWA
jgi:coproporphyrinogen III oxidase